MIGIPANADLSSRKVGKPTASRHQDFHRQAHEGHLTRRQFLKSGLALFGAAAGASVLRHTGLAAKPGAGIPKQIPDFSVPLAEAFGVEIPFLLPAEVDPFTISPDAVKTPTTIWDFNGSVGLVEADGVSDPAQNTDGVARRWACDVRFMRGVFVDREGRTQRGAFAFF